MPFSGTGVVLNVAPVVEDSETATDSEESVTENQSPALTLEEIDALRGKKVEPYFKYHLKSKVTTILLLFEPDYPSS